MSLARITRVEKSRKEWVCGRCRGTILKGHPVLHYAVGFRGTQQHRCTKPSCYPKDSELESSMVSSVYAEIEGVDFDSMDTAEEAEQALRSVAEECAFVSSEYELNPMFDTNYELQERAAMLQDAESHLSSWSFDDDEPVEDDASTWGDATSYDEARETWVKAMRESAQNHLDEVELP